MSSSNENDIIRFSPFMPDPISYADAGVSIDNANRAVAKIREYAKSTFNERTLTEIGSFGGMFSAAFPQMAEPILVASADGVAEIGYALVDAVHGRGIATTACRKLLELAWEDGATAIVAETDPFNLASRRVLAKAGFTQRGDGVFEVRR